MAKITFSSLLEKDNEIRMWYSDYCWNNRNMDMFTSSWFNYVAEEMGGRVVSSYHEDATIEIREEDMIIFLLRIQCE